jgi:dihydroorotate dehydrogenase electron transfer subunit
MPVKNQLGADHYADAACQYEVKVQENILLARDTYRIRFHCPELARQILPGQFVMVRLAGCDDPLLGRPFALYDTVLDEAGQPIGMDVVYLVIGKMTRRLAQCEPGCRLDIWGPLGNGFSVDPVEHLVMVAGGIGQTPFLALGRQFLDSRSYGDPQQQVQPAARVTLCYGVRSAEYLAGRAEFEQAGIGVRVSSDDGSVGRHGLVTELLEEILTEQSSQPSCPSSPAPCRVVCCGPEPMMQAVARLTHQHQVPCQVSLESPMACGIGICFSCVVRVVQSDGNWDYRRTCVDGPVFDARKIVWE